MEVSFQVTNQVIKRLDQNIVVADSQNYLVARFAFTDDWGKLAKTAIFKNEDTSYEVLLENDFCIVPWEVIKPPNFLISVVAGERITADNVSVPVRPSGYQEGETPSPPTPDIYAQIVEQYQKSIEKMEEATEEAKRAGDAKEESEKNANRAEQAAEAAEDEKLKAEFSAKEAEKFAQNAEQAETKITQSISAHNEDAEAHEELRESMHDVLLNYAAPAVIRTFGPARSGVISNAVPGARLRALSALGETALSAEPSPEAPAAFSSIETISGSIGGQALGPISTPLRAVPAASGWTARDSIDLLSGSLSRRIAVRTFTGSEAWTKYNVGSSDVSTSCFTCTLTDKAVGWGTSICSHFRNTRGTHPFSPSRMTHGIYCDHNQVRNIYVDWGEGPDVTAETFKAWLAEQNAAGTPVTLYYVLEAPATEPVQAQSFVLESGTAAVTATAEMRIDYLMDTGAALEELTNAVLAMGGELNV